MHHVSEASKPRATQVLADREFRPWRFNAELFAFLGLAAILFAIIGLAGLLALGVRERRKEIGIRAAIGAAPIHLLRMFLAKGMSLAGIGILLGLAGSLLTAGYLRSLLYGVEPWDSITLAVVTAVVLATAFVASLVPAQSAARVAPSEELRHH